MRRAPIAGRRPCRRFALDRRANFAVMTALCAPFAVALSAFAVDQGSLFTERREAQALVDLAAITAAANIANAETAVLTTLKDNGLASVAVNPAGESTEATGNKAVVDVLPGRYTRDPSIAAGKRFEAGRKPFNAVKVSLRKIGTLYFGSAIMAPPTIGTTAIASASAEAAFSVGSRLAQVDGGILNALLGGLLGGNISLTVMDYEALIDADVDLLSFLDALAVETHVRAATYADVLQSSATIGQIATAMAAVPGLDHSAKLALQNLAGAVSSNASIPLSHMLDLGPFGSLALGDRPAGLSAATSVMGVLSAGAALANRQNQARIDLAATLPGLVSATVDIAIGEPPQSSPWFTVGETGAVVRTAQTRGLITVEIGGPGGLLGTSIKLPVYAEVAFAEAKLTDISCRAGKPDSLRVGIAARPGVAELRIAEPAAGSLADFRNAPAFAPARIVQAPLLTVSGQALVSLSNVSPTNLTFTSQDIAGRTVKTVSTRDFTQSLTQSLLGNLQLDMKLLGLGLSLPSNLKPTLTALLGAVTPSLDTLLYNVLSALGVRLGEADVRVNDATCSRSVLVQ